MPLMHTKVSQSIVLINLEKTELNLDCEQSHFCSKSVSDCDLYVSINIPHSLSDFQANERLLEVQSIVSLIQLEGDAIKGLVGAKFR